jgi:septal ring factor EnvC (AmiA/AmiB activator)
MVRGLILPVFIIAVCSILFPQNQKIERQRHSLDSLKKEIKKLEGELQQANKREKKTYEMLQQYNKQVNLLDQLIAQLQQEAEEKTNSIISIQDQVILQEQKLKLLQEYYAGYVVGVYKKTFRNQFSYIINAESISQALLRYQYLKNISDRSAQDARQINLTRRDLLALKSNLEREKAAKTAIIVQKTSEENYLNRQMSEKKKVLAKIKVDKTALSRELDNKRAAEKRIHNLISQLIAKAAERRRNTETRTNEKQKTTTSNSPTPSRTTTTSPDPAASQAAVNMFKGRLLWPVNSGTVIAQFGESRNEKLNTVTINYGIDIRAGSESNVRSSADGEVAVIDWIPGYGTVIILSHANDVRTVYGRIAGVKVHLGQKIRAGDVLGAINESLEGNILHYEVWNERHSQNPESWLQRR